MNAQTINKKGFTIIEVVLVLAIAALIFLMVFLAWPALQRSQRDSARKNDASNVASAIGNYKSNNNGSITGLSTSSFAQYIPDLSQYEKSDVRVVTSGPANPDAPNNIMIYTRSKCSGNRVVSGTSREVAIVVKQESPSVNYCVGG